MLCSGAESSASAKAYFTACSPVAARSASASFCMLILMRFATLLFSQAADEARGLAIDSISKAESGHMGLPLGCAEIGAVLFGQELSYNPKDPQWINRDRFILSAGHGSMFLYSWLHMSGYDLPMEEVANFRVKDSKTPGHPEFGWTPGCRVDHRPARPGRRQRRRHGGGGEARGCDAQHRRAHDHRPPRRCPVR